ncbi:hypothetical protein DE146DRAFT_633419 [Phaeosphaeria sp. MPI-PUGE-AT-0046c]|nr:hypothetical protein DE146DRAFT_633419 [Phaeosphaeria sp. MPI-PUGE-AT-0046c]
MAHHLLFSRQFPGAPPSPPRSPEYLAENIAPRLLAIEITLFTLSICAILMRFYVRIFMLKMFGWDDWMMVISACLSTICFGLFLYLIHLGLGKHSEAFPMENFPKWFKVMYFYSISIISAYSFIKLSIGFFLLRLADRTRWRPFLIGMLGHVKRRSNIPKMFCLSRNEEHPGKKWSDNRTQCHPSGIPGVFLVVFTIGSVFAIIFQCIPVRAGYDFALRPPTGTAKCYAGEIFKNIGVFNSSINIATDLIFALIPIPMVWRLQVNLRTRIGLAIILSLGLFASGVAIYKTPMQYNFFKETDFSGQGAWYYIWQQVEMHIGILAACLPTLKPLFATFFGQIRTFTKGRSNGSNGISTPFKSSGYVKQDDAYGNSSFALKDMSDGSQSQPRSPYDEDVVLGKDLYTVKTNVGRRARRQSDAGESDESILGHGNRRSDGLRGMAIVRTTEVSVTR